MPVSICSEPHTTGKLERKFWLVKPEDCYLCACSPTLNAHAWEATEKSPVSSYIYKCTHTSIARERERERKKEFLWVIGRRRFFYTYTQACAVNHEIERRRLSLLSLLFSEVMMPAGECAYMCGWMYRGCPRGADLCVRLFMTQGWVAEKSGRWCVCMCLGHDFVLWLVRRWGNVSGDVFLFLSP